MQIFSRPLSEAVKKARTALGLTQGQVAEAIGIDQRTILNIENCKGNPKMKVLYPLIRMLRIDAREIFNPEMDRDDPNISRLRFTIESCNEKEAATLIPVVEAVLKALRNGESFESEDDAT